MSLLKVPTETGPDVEPYSQRVLLDGTPYRLGFRWNDRASVWAFSISTEADDLLCGPISIRNGFPLTAQFRTIAGMPQGHFFAWAQTEPERDAGADELGGRVVLYYQEAA